MRIAFISLLLVLACALRADAESDYAALLESHKNKQWARALQQAEAFAKDHAEFKHTHAALWMGGNAGLNCDEFVRAEVLYRALLKDFPQSRHIEKARNELVTLLVNARELERCITQCQQNLVALPQSDNAERWRYTIGECRFRLWDFKQAEADLKLFLKDFPAGALKARAESCLAQINPPLKVGPDGIVQGYAGKYVGDVRLDRAQKALPGYMQQSLAQLRQTLGVDLAGKAAVLIEFKDKGFDRDTERAVTTTIAIDYKPVTLMTFYTEFVVVSDSDFRSRITHELKHAAFRGIMGQAYLNLPKWVREGLAVYGAGQTNDRICAVLGGRVFSGKDPRGVLDGIDDADHTSDDYVEDALAFEWLEKRKTGAVAAFCKRLLAGEACDKLFAELSGLAFAPALQAASKAIAADIEARLGKAEKELVSLQDEQLAAASRKQDGKWATDFGIAKFSAWLEANPGHLLVPNARYRLARACIAAQDYAQGRKWLALVVADDERCTLTDDAQYWIARSLELEGKTSEAEAAYGVLLRDYCWSSYAAALKDKYKQAGPVKE